MRELCLGSHVSTALFVCLVLVEAVANANASVPKEDDSTSSLRQYLRSNKYSILPREIDECSLECCHQLFEPSCGNRSANPFTQIPLALQIILMTILIGMSAFFSGLTLGVRDGGKETIKFSCIRAVGSVLSERHL